MEDDGETKKAVRTRDRQEVGLKMLRVSVGIIRVDKIKKESIRETAQETKTYA